MKIVSKSRILGIFAAIIVVLFLIMLPRLYEDVKNEQIVVNQQIYSGNMDYWTTPGWKWRLFGRTTTYFKTNQVWFNGIEKDERGEYHAVGNTPAFPIRYADKGSGFVLGSVRIELPLRDDKLALIQQHYGSERRLISELIEPTIGKVILACGPLMTSLESVSDKRNDLIAYATDQLNSGVYVTESRMVERLNAITGEMERYQQAFIVTDTLGNPKRQEASPFDIYGLKVSQLAIADLVYDNATMNQINRQREANLEIITAKSEAAKAQQITIQVEEQGKQNAARARWEQEVIKATEVTKAQQQKEVAQLEAERATYVAEKTIQEKRAEAEANRLLVAAGLTPLERAKIDQATAIGVAHELANSKHKLVPEFMILSGDGKNASANPLDAVGINMLLDITKKMTPSK